MRPYGVVVASPGFDDDLGLLQCVEDFAVEQLIAQFAIEAFVIAVLPRASRFDVRGLGTNRGDPFPKGKGNELRPVVGTYV